MLCSIWNCHSDSGKVAADIQGGNGMKVSTLVFPVTKTSVLLARKKSGVGAGLYNGWGGKLEPEDEGNLKACACREFLAESGAYTSRKNLRKMAVVDFFEAGVHIFECYVYFCFAWNGQLRETPEMGRPRTFPLASIPYDRMMPADVIWLKEIFLGKRFRGRVYYNKGNTKLEKFEHGPL